MVDDPGGQDVTELSDPVTPDAGGDAEAGATDQQQGAAGAGVPAHRPRKSFFSRYLVGSIVVAFLVVVLAVAGGGWLWFSSAESGSPGEGVVLTVSIGEGFSAIRSALVGSGVVSSNLAFELYVAIHGAPSVEPGQYYLRKDDGFAAVLSVLQDPPNVLTLQIPPGFTVAEISGRLEAAGFVDLGNEFASLATSGKVTSPFQPAGSKNLDGLLAAGNYQVLPVESASSLLEAMITRFTASAAQAGLSPGDDVNGLDAYQVVTVASIVEKEGVIQKNLAKVSRVIYNRLARDMPLQMDSTVLYSLGQDGGPVTPADLQIKSPYNTYLNTGLTPTPICFPSTEALGAALHPAAGAWLYFTLVSEDGTEAFADTYAQQVANQKLAQQRGLP
ncbi:MAG: endolytic transglycosylase MltG [Acidimicrobiales bacterium]